MSATTLTPHIGVRNSAEAVEFYQKAFGAQVLNAYKIPDGRVMHATLSIQGAILMLADEFPEHGGKSPQALNGTPVTLHLTVPDCDAVFQQAVASGCTVRMPLEDMFWGDRYGIVTDPYGHQWSIATPKRDVSPQELQAMADGFSSEGQCPGA